MEKWDEFSQNKQAIVAVAMALTTTCLIFLLLRFLLAGASLEIVQLSITLVGVGAASLLAIVAMRRQRSNEITVGLDEVRQSSERIASLRGRFVTAAEAIGSDSKAVQFAGAYAMANLADEWLLAETDSREAQTCVNVLCAYLRQQGNPISEGKEAVDSTVDQVEETILKSIASRVRPKEEKERGSWSHLDFDFGGGTFSGARFMEGAVFVGTVSFAGSRFTSEVLLLYTQFLGSVDFRSAVFEADVYFSRRIPGEKIAEATIFGAQADFSGARFIGNAFFESAIFHKSVNFVEATFEKDANFGRGGDKEDDETWYEGTRFQDRASFARARFGGAITMTRDTVMKNGLSFEHANFDGAANFMGARFEGDVDFSHAVFARHAQFYLASFDGITTFRDAEFNNSANFFEIVH